MCRLALQLLGMLGNVLGMLCNVLGMLCKVLGRLVVHYFLGFTAYKAASGGVSLRCGTPRTLQKHAEVGQEPCKACLGRCKTCLGYCQACLGVAKQAYTS